MGIIHPIRLLNVAEGYIVPDSWEIPRKMGNGVEGKGDEDFITRTLRKSGGITDVWSTIRHSGEKGKDDNPDEGSILKPKVEPQFKVEPQKPHNCLHVPRDRTFSSI